MILILYEKKFTYRKHEGVRQTVNGTNMARTYQHVSYSLEEFHVVQMYDVSVNAVSEEVFTDYT